MSILVTIAKSVATSAGIPMSEQVFMKEYDTPKHSQEHKALSELCLSLHRANVALILSGAADANDERKLLLRVASAHLLSGVNTLASILSLTKKLSLKMKEAVALTRVFYETSLVAAFTCVGGPERARRAELYSVYNMFRNQTKVEKAGGKVIRVSREPKLSRKDPRYVPFPAH